MKSECWFLLQAPATDAGDRPSRALHPPLKTKCWTSPADRDVRFVASVHRVTHHPCRVGTSARRRIRRVQPRQLHRDELEVLPARLQAPERREAQRRRGRAWQRSDQVHCWFYHRSRELQSRAPPCTPVRLQVCKILFPTIFEYFYLCLHEIAYIELRILCFFFIPTSSLNTWKL